MSEKRCERCGARRSKPGAGEYDLLDYCAHCSRDLCDACMEKGCCGRVPAASGTAWDHGDDEPGYPPPTDRERFGGRS